MNDNIKNLILFISTSVSFLNDYNKNEVSQKVQIELKSILKKYENIADLLSYNCTNKEIDKLIADIESGNIKFDMIKKVDEIKNNKKLGKRQVIVKRGDLDSICLHALEHTCKKCTRNKKRCSLRTAFIGCDIEPYNNDKTKCPYDYN